MISVIVCDDFFMAKESGELFRVISTVLIPGKMSLVWRWPFSLSLIINRDEKFILRPKLTHVQNQSTYVLFIDDNEPHDIFSHGSFRNSAAQRFPGD